MEKGGIISTPDELLSYECHSKHAAPSFQEIEELDNKLSQLETEVKEMNDNESNLQRNYLELVELEVCGSPPPPVSPSPGPLAPWMPASCSNGLTCPARLALPLPCAVHCQADGAVL
jgi:hypothetical protein